MTAKRFTISSYSDKLYDKEKGNHYYYEDMSDWYKICDLLNSLAEDNKMLNRMIDKRDGWNNLAHEQLFKLGKENEQLKQSNKELLLLVDTLKEQNMKFKTRLNDLGVEYYD